MRDQAPHDLAIIGAGSAGFSAAITAAELGARVALIGHGTIGGTCVNTGCVPSKNLIRVKGQARVTEGGIAVDGNLIRADNIIIATGASPAVPPIPGIETVPYLTSTTALDLAVLPRSLLVIGGGYVGCQLGQMFARAGVVVRIVDIVPILSAGEPEISTALAGYLREEGIALHEGVRPTAIRETARGVALDLSAGGKSETIEAEQVLVSTGRRPNTAGLGLEEAGIELLPSGGVKVDDQMRTTRAGIYAAGDVTGRDQFVYMAAYSARIAAENALNGDGRCYDTTAMPYVVFTDPQMASVGLTEAQAREQGLSVKTSVLSLDQVPRATPAGSSSSLPTREAARSSARTCWRRRAPTASRRRRSRSKAGSPSGS